MEEQMYYVTYLDGPDEQIVESLLGCIVHEGKERLEKKQHHMAHMHIDLVEAAVHMLRIIVEEVAV